MYVRDHDDGTLRDFLPPLRWSELEDLKQGVHFVMVYAFDPSGATAGPQLMVSLTQPDCVRVSPTGRAAIIVIPTNLGSATGTVEQLWVAPTDGSKPAVLISSNVAANPDWSADGRDVVFVRGVEDNKLLATLRRVRVIGDNGQIAAHGYDDLAGLLFDSGTRVRCLGDGRIIFSSVEVTLPATPDDVGQRVELFAVEPGKQATVSRLLTSKALAEVGDSAQYFEVSPDGSRVSIPDRTGTVDVVDLATGAVTPVQGKTFPKPAQGDGALSAVPTWRGNDELTFVAPGENDRPQVMLWSLSGKKGEVLSATWPSTITDELAPKPAGH
jgi:dipeptidyl aminopeptidase/acylaminoacyl peptidase